ncbi:hypothetical protein ACP4OV_000299 [Aristida adscensionis]
MKLLYSLCLGPAQNEPDNQRRNEPTKTIPRPGPQDPSSTGLSRDPASARAAAAAMLRVLSELRRLRAAAPPPPASLLRLPLSTTAEFATEEYLVASCGLTPAQARKASKYLPHLRCPENPEAVLASLAGVGLDKAGVGAAVLICPTLLTCKVDKTLAPRLARLREIGLSPAEICRLITVVPEIIFSPVKISRLEFYLSFLGSFDKVHSALVMSNYLLRRDLDRIVRPNIALLQQCGLTDDDIRKRFLQTSRVLAADPERLKELVLRADELGVPRNSGMFKQALLALYGIKPERVSAKLDFFKRVLGCSEAEARIVVCKAPDILRKSEDKIAGRVKFLKEVIGLEPSYIAHRAALLGYSIEKRMVPRYYIIKILRAKGLVSQEFSYYYTICMSEKSFVEKFLAPYKESDPGLLDAYAAARKGQVPPELLLSKLEI